MDNVKHSFTDRKALLNRLRDESQHNNQQSWDVIVVGGGIVGAGILQEATKRGLTALLIEQKDFAWGTSSRSSKMIHGGLRYIAQGDIKLTKQSLTEREILLQQAPGLINRLGNYFVIRQKQFPGRFIMNTLLYLYDWLAGIKDHKFMPVKDLLEKFPNLTKNKLKGACYYTDAVVDDARLVLRVLQQSVESGANILNYVKATSLLKDPSTERVLGITIKENTCAHTDNLNEEITLTSSIVINATGAWADKLRNEVIDEKRIRPLRGSHLVIARDRLPVMDALLVLHPTDKRPVFIYPWEGATIIGTTDLDHHENLDSEASISQHEVDYLLQLVSHSFPSANITTKDIISTFSGVRPVITSEQEYKTRSKVAKHSKAKKPSKERRDHAVWADNALITASGGKLTTFRLTATEALNAAKPWLKTRNQHDTDHNKVIDRHRLFINKPLTQLFSSAQLMKIKHSKAWLQRLLGRYGNNTAMILTQTNESEQLALGQSQFCLAECRWAIKHEAVIHLDDLLLRRTRLGLLLTNGGEALFQQLATIFYQELGWDNAKWQDEVTRYKKIWRKSYYLPET